MGLDPQSPYDLPAFSALGGGGGSGEHTATTC